MAQNGAPVESASEAFSPTGIGGVNSECPVDGAIFPLSKSSVDVVVSPLQPDDLPKSSSSPSCSRTASYEPTETSVTDVDLRGGSQGEPRLLDTAELQHSPCGGPPIPETVRHSGGKLGETYGPQAQENQAGIYRPQVQVNQAGTYGPQAQENQGGTYGPQAPENQIGKYGPQAHKNQAGRYGPQAQENQAGRYGPQAQENPAGLCTSHSSSPITVETPRPRPERPRSIAETAPSYHMGAVSQPEAVAHGRLHVAEGGGVACRGSSSSLRDEQLPPTPQQVHRSLSAGLQTAREPPRRSESSAPCGGAGYCGRSMPCCPTLVCKQPMQLLQRNTMTTCRSSGSSSPTQQLGAACGGVRICAPGPPHGEAAGAEEPCFLSHGGLDDTFAAYCHPLPIPAPPQLPPRPPHPALLAFPRLMSSVSETGLDAKRLIGYCGGADCQEPGGAYHVPPPLLGDARVTRETGTMTSHGELRDVGVQTGPPESPPPHVFPEVSLATDEGGGGGEGPNGAVGGQKSPIKEVMWDAEGMTWEVYGASVDPEELGLAIQKHLELQIKEKAGRVAQLVRQDTASSQQSRRRKRRGFMMGSLRNPVCCARSSTMVD